MRFDQFGFPIASEEILTNKNFTKWFGHSITKRNGLPIIFYHISKAKEKIECFTNIPVFFTEAKDGKQAEYIGYRDNGGEHKRNVYLCYLKILHPYNFYDNQQGLFDNSHNKIDIIDIPSRWQQIQYAGYDSIIINRTTYFSEFLIFDNAQIKSIDNKLFKNKNNINK